MTREWLQLRTAAVLVALAAVHSCWGLSQSRKKWEGVASLPGQTIDLATASWPEIAWLPGIGAQTARRIALERVRLGFPLHLGNLSALPSVGEGTVDGIPINWLRHRSGEVVPDRQDMAIPYGGVPPPK